MLESKKKNPELYDQIHGSDLNRIYMKNGRILRKVLEGEDSDKTGMRSARSAIRPNEIKVSLQPRKGFVKSRTSRGLHSDVEPIVANDPIAFEYQNAAGTSSFLKYTYDQNRKEIKFSFDGTSMQDPGCLFRFRFSDNVNSSKPISYYDNVVLTINNGQCVSIPHTLYTSNQRGPCLLGPPTIVPFQTIPQLSCRFLVDNPMVPKITNQFSANKSQNKYVLNGSPVSFIQSWMYLTNIDRELLIKYNNSVDSSTMPQTDPTSVFYVHNLRNTDYKERKRDPFKKARDQLSELKIFIPKHAHSFKNIYDEQKQFDKDHTDMAVSTVSNHLQNYYYNLTAETNKNTDFMNQPVQVFYRPNLKNQFRKRIEERLELDPINTNLYDANLCSNQLTTPSNNTNQIISPISNTNQFISQTYNNTNIITPRNKINQQSSVTSDIHHFSEFLKQEPAKKVSKIRPSTVPNQHNKLSDLDKIKDAKNHITKVNALIKSEIWSDIFYYEKQQLKVQKLDKLRSILKIQRAYKNYRLRKMKRYFNMLDNQIHTQIINEINDNKVPSIQPLRQFVDKARMKELEQVFDKKGRRRPNVSVNKAAQILKYNKFRFPDESSSSDDDYNDDFDYNNINNHNSSTNMNNYTNNSDNDQNVDRRYSTENYQHSSLNTNYISNIIKVPPIDLKLRYHDDNNYILNEEDKVNFVEYSLDRNDGLPLSYDSKNQRYTAPFSPPRILLRPLDSFRTNSSSSQSSRPFTTPLGKIQPSPRLDSMRKQNDFSTITNIDRAIKTSQVVL